MKRAFRQVKLQGERGQAKGTEVQRERALRRDGVPCWGQGD